MHSTNWITGYKRKEAMKMVGWEQRAGFGGERGGVGGEYGQNILYACMKLLKNY